MPGTVEFRFFQLPMKDIAGRQPVKFFVCDPSPLKFVRFLLHDPLPYPVCNAFAFFAEHSGGCPGKGI